MNIYIGLFRDEKLERLKKGPPKHQFTDQKYLRNRDIIMDKTEDAFEAGIEAFEKKGIDALETEKKIKAEYSDELLSDSDSDFDIYGQPVPSSSNQKRKHSNVLNKKKAKKQKLDHTC